MSHRTLRLPIWLTCFVLAITLIIGGVANPAAASTGAADTAAADQPKAALQTSFAPVVKKVMPSIVNIFSSRKVETQSQFSNDLFFRRFFGDQSGGRQMVPRERQERSLGSGVIVSSDGYILTNNHVVDGGTDIKVSLNDKREFTAKVVGTDSKTDLAVLK
jgi:serine protease Do